MSVSAVLVREFGQGDNLRKFVTETVDGKIITKAFDSKGVLLKERVKSFSDQIVGDKFVKTITKDIKYKSKHPILGDKKPWYWSIRDVIDKVYKKQCDSSHTKLGERITHYSTQLGEPDKVCVLKKTSTGKETLTKFGGIGHCYDGYKTRFEKQIRYDKNGSNCYFVDYNLKGLPVPDWAHPADPNVATASLKDIVDLHYGSYPNINYLPKSCGLKGLNKTASDGVKRKYYSTKYDVL